MRWKCGKDKDGNQRYCTDEELDVVEGVRAGTLKAVDPKAALGVDMSSLESGLRSIGDEIREAVENLPSHIGDEIASRPVEFVDYAAFKQHRDSCPECKAAYDAELEEALPGFAHEHGYTAKEVVEAPAPVEEAPVQEVPAEPAVAPAPDPEPEPEPEEELSLLDRVIPVKE